MSDPVVAIASYNHNADIQLNYEEIADLFEYEQSQNMNNMDAAQQHLISDDSDSEGSSFAFDSGLARPISRKKVPAIPNLPTKVVTKKAVPVSASRPLKKRGRRLSELVPREVTASTSAAPADYNISRRVSIGNLQNQEPPVTPPPMPATMPMTTMAMYMQQPNILTHQVYFQQRLDALMVQSQASLKALQDYDKSQGLPASHCATMVKSYRSRKQLLTGKILKKWDGTPLIHFQANADGSVTVRSGDRKERKKAVKKEKPAAASSK